MAFTIEGEKQGKGITKPITIVVGILIFGFATYYLFFATPPQIEVLIPRELMTISQISSANLDPSEIIESPAYKSLMRHVDPPVLGDFGRINPFAKF